MRVSWASWVLLYPLRLIFYLLIFKNATVNSLCLSLIPSHTRTCEAVSSLKVGEHRAR